MHTLYMCVYPHISTYIYMQAPRIALLLYIYLHRRDVHIYMESPRMHTLYMCISSYINIYIHAVASCRVASIYIVA